MTRTWEQVVASGFISGEEMELLGLERRELTVVRFMGERTDKRWFYRDHEELGRISTLCVDGVPVRKDEMFSFVAENFGTNCGVLW